MKTWMIVSFFVLIVLIVSGYLLYPPPSGASRKTGVRTSAEGAYRIMSNQLKWDTLTEGSFTVTRKLVNTLHINFKQGKDSLSSTILFIPLRKDSVDIIWQFRLSPEQSLPFWKRCALFNRLNEKMNLAITNFKQHLLDDRNIYGITIEQTSTKDTSLLAKRFSTSQYPTTQEIYTHIGDIEQRARQLGAQPSGFPMLNVTQEDSSRFRCMVAVPINKILYEQGNIFSTRMVPGQFLTTQVQGGPYTINYAHQMLQLYFKDYKRISMAIPFEYLVTNRLTESDTSKWITRIYGPVY